MNQRSERVDEVDGEDEDLCASLGLVLEQGVVEAVVLEVLVSSGGDGHDLVESGSELGAVEGADVGGEVGVDVGEENLVDRVGGGGGGERSGSEGRSGGKDAGVVGVDEFEDLYTRRGGEKTMSGLDQRRLERVQEDV